MLAGDRNLWSTQLREPPFNESTLTRSNLRITHLETSSSPLLDPILPQSWIDAFEGCSTADGKEIRFGKDLNEGTIHSWPPLKPPKSAPPFPLLATKNCSHQILARVLTAIQPPGAETKKPAKMMVEMWERVVWGGGGSGEEGGKLHSMP